jgi:hypothetical protein
MILINETKYYTTDEVSEKFGVSSETIRRWRSSGKLAYYQQSEKKFFYTDEAIQQCIMGTTHQTGDKFFEGNIDVGQRKLLNG